ncbi:MAG: hypothetical protein FVQ81_16850 [Candidatus Glassbacteria bacterium]|nr:hypothetical protein [Candidatus Glassbacteria bacterium]
MKFEIELYLPGQAGDLGKLVASFEPAGKSWAEQMARLVADTGDCGLDPLQSELIARLSLIDPSLVDDFLGGI